MDITVSGRTALNMSSLIMYTISDCGPLIRNYLVTLLLGQHNPICGQSTVITICNSVSQSRAHSIITWGLGKWF